jgi:radical SAM protein with 4Fe4S-binding SPASM domain
MCYTITEEFKQQVNAKLMDWALYTKVIDEIARGGTYSIRLSFRGESFLHKKIVEAVKYAKASGIKEVSTLTNGVRLDEEMFTQIMEAGIDWITISADGIGEVYEKIRMPAKFPRLIEKLQNFQKIKKEANRVKPVIKIQSILPAIENDIDAFYSAFAPVSDMVSTNPLIDFHQSKADAPKIENFVCPQIFQRLVVGADGLVMMCANDEVGSHIVGDAKNESIRDIWHGERMNEIRNLHRSHKAIHTIEACKNCYLPLKTFDDKVIVEGRTVTAAKYIGGKERVSDLNTPDKYKRDGLNI